MEHHSRHPQTAMVRGQFEGFIHRVKVANSVGGLANHLSACVCVGDGNSGLRVLAAHCSNLSDGGPCIPGRPLCHHLTAQKQTAFVKLPQDFDMSAALIRLASCITT